MPAPIEVKTSSDILFYVVDHLHMTGVPDETFVIGQQGVDLSVEAVLADVTAKMTPTDPDVVKFIPTGERRFSATLKSLVTVNMNGGIYSAGDRKSFSEIIADAEGKVKGRFVIETFPGTPPLYADRECFKGYGWLKDLKLNASNHKEAATYSAEFEGTGVLSILPTT